MTGIKKINIALQNVAEKLLKDGMNYTVSIELFRAGNVVDESVSVILRECFEDGATSGDHKYVLKEDLIDRLRKH
ncbi:MAG: hypothetical protein ACRBF0_05345 [Calditrichia bacterium]